MAASTGVIHYLQTSDAVTHAVAWVLLAMSVASWCFVFVKSWMLVRAKRQGPRALAQFWQTRTLSEGVATLRRADRERLFLPLAEAALVSAEADVPGVLNSWALQGFFLRERINLEGWASLRLRRRGA